MTWNTAFMGLLVASTMWGCARTEPPLPSTSAEAETPVTPTVESKSATPQAVNPKPQAVKPQPVRQSKPTVASTSPQTDPAKMSAKELERNPGVTPNPPLVKVKPGPAHPSLAGAPMSSPAFGPDSALVKVYIFSDFQCPVCRRVVEPVKAAARQFGDQVQFIFKHNALEMHPRATAAAKASIAAFNQDKFWEFHDLLFKDQRALADADFIRHAETLGLDIERFKADLVAQAVDAQVIYERKMAEAIGARGTPGFFINGKKQVGWGSAGSFNMLIRRALAEAQGLVSSGTPADKVVAKAMAASGAEGAKLAELLFGKP